MYRNRFLCSALCRPRRELSNAYFLAKFCLDTAENEPCQVCPTEHPRRLSPADFPICASELVGGASEEGVLRLDAHPLGSFVWTVKKESGQGTGKTL